MKITARMRTTGKVGITDGRDIRNNPSLVGCRIPSGSLTTYNGVYNPNPGEVVQGLHITDAAATADNVVYRDCIIDGGIGNYPVFAANALAEYCTIGIDSGTPKVSNLRYGGMTLRYCVIHGASDNLTLNGNATYPTVIDACYVHGLRQIDITDHNDNGQMTSGASTTVTRCWFDRDDAFGQTSQLGIGADVGNISNVTITYNLFEKSMDVAGCQCIIWGQSGSFTATNVLIDHNFIHEYRYTTVLNANQPYTWTNNSWWPSGDPCVDGQLQARARP